LPVLAEDLGSETTGVRPARPTTADGRSGFPALAWALSRYWRDLGTASEATRVPMAGRVAELDGTPRIPEAN
jgi:hypothetical protein